MRGLRSVGARMTLAAAAVHLVILAVVFASGVLAGGGNATMAGAALASGLLLVAMAGGLARDLDILRRATLALTAGEPVGPLPAGGDAGRIATAVATLAERLNDTDRALDECRALHRDLLDSMPALVAVKDAELRFVLANRRHDEWLGLDETDMLGHRIDDLLPADQAVGLLAAEQAALVSGRMRDIERTLSRPDGSPLVIWQANFPIPGRDGRPARLGTVAFDIGERKRAERSLAESEAWLRSIVVHAPAYFTLKDTAGRYILCSERSAGSAGLTVEDVLGKTVYDLFPKEAADALAAADRQVIETGRPLTLENPLGDSYPHRHSDVMTKFPVPGPAGVVGGVGTVGVDLRDLRQAERALSIADQRFKDFVETASDWVWETDVEHRYTYISKRFYELMGRTPAEYLGRTRLELAEIAPDDPIWRRHLADLAARRPFRDLDLIKTDVQGRRHRMRVSGVPVFSVDDRFVGYRGSGRDITREREREAELAQAQKLTAIGELTGGIAHDFNNLLGVVLTNLELLAETQAGNDVVLKIVNRAIRATMRGADLTRGLVAFARRQSLQPSRADINDLVGHLIDMLRRTLGETIEVQTRLAAGLWPGYVDPAGLESALVNLAVNARDAMPDGGVLTITTENVTLNGGATGQAFEPVPGDYVCLIVADTGEGIPSEALSRIFEPFFTTKEVGRGSGLGLSMVYGFVKQSGGYVTVDSTLGLGTRVTLYLPRAYALPDGTEVKHRSEDEARVEVPTGKGETILVVEDEISVRDVVVEILEALGYRVVAAADGRAALACLEQGPRPDLLFTDMVLPGGLNGRDIAQAAQRRYADLPVLFTSGYSRLGDELARAEQPGIGFLRKPFRRLSLAVELRRLLDARSV